MGSSILVDILEWLALLLVLSLFYYFWRKLQQKWEDKKQTAFSGSQRDSGERTNPMDGDTSDEDALFRELQRRQQELEDRARREKLRELLRRDPELGQYISDMAGVGTSDLTRLDDTDLDRIARRIDDDVLDMMYVASKDIPVELDLDSSGTQMHEVPTGGQYYDVTGLRGVDQVTRMMPEEFGYPKAMRHARMVTGEARRIRRFAITQDSKLLYILRDRSGSMTNPMRDDLKKDAWARGVVFKYALLALSGKTQFYFRDFDEEPKALQRVLNRSDVNAFITYLRMHPAPDNAGTAILVALKRAVKDIKEATESGIGSAEIVLISDGEDNSVSDTSAVSRLLKGIKLHVIMIGAENPSLRSVAATYKVV